MEPERASDLAGVCGWRLPPHACALVARAAPGNNVNASGGRGVDRKGRGEWGGREQRAEHMDVESRLKAAVAELVAFESEAGVNGDGA